MKKPVYKRSQDFFETEHLVEIWGKSYCPYCDKAKALCTKEDLKYTYYQLDEDYTKEELLLLFPNVKTLPQITVDNKYIGGYKELRNYLGVCGFNDSIDAWGNFSR
jgi:glutaredoxin